MKQIILAIIIILAMAGSVNAYNGDFCNSTHTPCGGGCTSTDLTDMYKNYNFITDPSGVGDITGWNTSCIDIMKGLFEDAIGFNQDISGWDTSVVTDMRNMFYSTSLFNQDISGWDTSSVTSMEYMFADSVFDQNITSWDVSSVTSMAYMFRGADFNSDISGWNTLNVQQMDYMFYAGGFNKPIGGWDTSSVTSMDSMFAATDFNQDISGWNTSSVDNMNSMFDSNPSFNQPIGSWDTSSVTDMVEMFFYSTSFNQDISGWNTSSVTNMNSMFYHAINFNQEVSSWDVSNVGDFAWMFSSDGIGTLFNSDISGWNTSSATNLEGMFYNAINFNQNISGWDTSLVTNIDLMFSQDGVLIDNMSFNQDLGNWNISSLTDATEMFTYTGSSLSVINYNSLLNGWYNQPHPSGITLGVGDTKYSPSAATSRAGLVTDGWTITDGGLLTCSFCTETCSPCGGGCNATDLTNMYNGYNFTADPSGVGDITGWDTSCITNINGIFSYSDFNQNINSWNTSLMTDMGHAFEENTVFNQPLSMWDTSTVTDMNDMFIGATSFNQDISAWNTGRVTLMYAMFSGIDETSEMTFNQPLNSWNVSSVTKMNSMFDYNHAFNQPLNSWDVSSVTDMRWMFEDATSFNQDLGTWDVSSVTTMAYMFAGATSFDQNLSGWYFEIITDMTGMFTGVTLSTPNYDSFLINLATTYGESNVAFGGGNSQYTILAEPSRNQLLSDGWTITDGGLACIEDWQPYYSNVCNGILPNRTLLYNDTNNCGTYNDLPVGNGTVSSCCVESWIPSYDPTTCPSNSIWYRTYTDSNACGTTAAKPSDGNTSCTYTPPVYDNQTFNGVTTTDLNTVADIAAVENFTVASSTSAVQWTQLLNLTDIVVAEVITTTSSFISIDIIAAPELDSPAAVALSVPTTFFGACEDFALYYATGYYTTQAELVANGRIVATGANVGGDCIDPTICTNVQCVAGTLTFTAQHFDGFGIGDIPASVIDSCQNTRQTVYLAFAIIALIGVVLAAFLLLAVLKGGNLDAMMVVLTIISLGIIVMIGYIVIYYVSQALC